MEYSIFSYNKHFKFYRITWRKKKDDNVPAKVGPILWHRKNNPLWAKEAAPYTQKEAFAACRRWNMFCPGSIHEVITVKRGGVYNEKCT